MQCIGSNFSAIHKTNENEFSWNSESKVLFALTLTEIDIAEYLQKQTLIR